MEANADDMDADEMKALCEYGEGRYDCELE